MKTMDVTSRVFWSLGFGAIIGAALGLGLGLTWVDLVQTGNSEGYDTMLVFFGFVPIGALIGSIVAGFTVGLHILKRQQLPEPMREHTS